VGGSPMLWCEVADYLALHCAIARDEVERYVEVLRGCCTPDEARVSIPSWYSSGVTPHMLARSLASDNLVLKSAERHGVV
jgi:hypothetical protein